ncbi:CBS domain-containing protein [Natrinema longum]|uniref:CBS domain-containing protein n=1 Tax=Natrinema longum TaxID=370324 RepID=A0A8A2UA66_9EURY|nr:CBS domain-containing protein [Natrinema longum]MBZ6496509.1 CBS domain-containing protein [Natrinema longum]QSW85586.1 CBS domain-containing protein [Natrinema longum]
MSLGKLGPQNVVTTSPDSDLEEITATLEEENVGSVVVTEDDEPIGMLTDRDAALAIHEHDDVGSASVEDVMTDDPVTVHEDDDPLAISEAIRDNNVRGFPIVDDDGELAGIATLDDLVATIGEELENVANTIEAQSPEYSP